MNVQKEKLNIMEAVGKVETVLDVGCGNGEMLNYFLEKGCSVCGIDKKEQNISNPKFRFIQQDIREYKFEEKFDLVICSAFLHFFMPVGANYLIKKMQESTNDKGYNLLVCMSSKDKLFEKNPTHFYTTLEELSLIYKDWEIVKKIEGETEKEDHDGIGEHTHNLILVLFRKK